MGNPTIDASLKQLTEIEASKKKHADTLQSNRDELFKVPRRADVQLMMILFILLQSGPSLAALPSGSPKGNSGASIVEGNEDKLRETGVQKSVTNAFSSVLTDAQNALNNKDGTPQTLMDMRQKLMDLRQGLADLSDTTKFPAGSPFDSASITSINASIDALIGPGNPPTGGIYQEINNVGGLKQLYINAQTPGDTTGSANILKRATDQLGTIGTSTQTISSMVSTKTNMVAADLQTMQGFLNSFIRSLADGLKSFNKAPQ